MNTRTSLAVARCERTRIMNRAKALKQQQNEALQIGAIRDLASLSRSIRFWVKEGRLANREIVRLKKELR
jgi:hypothetical protein